jgi:hypothetical protein
MSCVCCVWEWAVVDDLIRGQDPGMAMTIYLTYLT